MQPKKLSKAFLIFQADLNQCLDMSHSLLILGKAIDWSVFEEAFRPFYCEDNGRPAKMIRLLVGLHYLKHAFDPSTSPVLSLPKGSGQVFRKLMEAFRRLFLRLFFARLSALSGWWRLQRTRESMFRPLSALIRRINIPENRISALA